MPTHIFIDNSNLFAGAVDLRTPDVPRFSVRLYYPSLIDLLERGHEAVETRFMAGSAVDAKDPWSSVRRRGYEIGLYKRVRSADGRLAEQGVDEMLHLKIANTLLDYEAPQTLVLATGDGNEDTVTKTSFPLQVQRALRRRWNVEVWSWRNNLSAAFRNLPLTEGGTVAIRILDPFYEALTFVQAGVYTEDGVVRIAVPRHPKPLVA